MRVAKNAARLSGNGALIRPVSARWRARRTPDRQLRPQRYGMSGSGGETVKRLMRDFKGMKRQRGRNRGGSSGGGGKPLHNVNRAFESNGPDNVKIRGNAQHVSRSTSSWRAMRPPPATASSARTTCSTPNITSASCARFSPTVRPARSSAATPLASGFDIDFEDESGAQAAGEDASTEGGEGDQQAQGDTGEVRGERQDRDRQQDRDREWRRDDRPQGRPPRLPERPLPRRPSQGRSPARRPSA